MLKRYQRTQLAALAGLALAANAGAQLQPIALTDTDGPLGPNLGPGVQFDAFELGSALAGPSLSSSGAVTFWGTLTGTGVDTSNNIGVWARRGGASLSVVARKGDQVAGETAGVLFSDFNSPPQIADNNVVVFDADLAGPGLGPSNDGSLLTERDGPMVVAIRERTTQVPGSDPALFYLDPNFAGNTPMLSRDGAYITRCHWEADGNTWGVWSDRDGGISELFRIGAEWTDGTNTVEFSGCAIPQINASGAHLAPRLEASVNGGIWTDCAVDGSGFGTAGVGELHPIARPGQVAPGTGSTWGTMIGYSYALNDNGRVAFGAQFQPVGPGVPGGLWSDARFGVVQLVALSNAAAPGTNGVFNSDASFVHRVVLSNNNCVAFLGQLLQSGGVGGGNDTGIWTTRSAATGLPSILRLLVREGDNVPAGLGPDYTGLRFGDFESLWINASGRVAFVTLHNDFTRGLWVENADGSLSPIVKEFTFFDVFGDGSTMRLITEIETVPNHSGTGDGRRSAFNDNGDVAVRLVFSDGSEGIYTTAPTPACDAPTITDDPDGGFINPGNDLTLTVDSEGTGPRTYQWRLDGAPIDGAVFPSYTITSAEFSDAGDYDCVVSNACGDTPSAAATVVVDITCLGDVTTTGTGPMDPQFGTPDGVTDLADLLYFVNIWNADLGTPTPNPGSLADTTTTGGGNPGEPDGNVDLSDLLYFVNDWTVGLTKCPSR